MMANENAALAEARTDGLYRGALAGVSRNDAPSARRMTMSRAFRAALRAPE
jgi:hypothetical protein